VGANANFSRRWGAARHLRGNLRFCSGSRSAAIEPELLLRKHFGWPGLGLYADGLFRWNRTTHNDLYITDVGLFQQLKGWELDLGYRHLQTVTARTSRSPSPMIRPASFTPGRCAKSAMRFEAGFSYTTSRSHLRYAFHSRTVVDGNNTDAKFWLGASLDIPFGGND